MNLVKFYTFNIFVLKKRRRNKICKQFDKEYNKRR